MSYYQRKRIFQVIVLFLLIFVFIRFFSIVTRFVGAAATSIQHFWWLALILLLGGWLFYVMRKRF